MRGTITSALPLTPEDVARFENKFTAMLGKSVQLELRVDPRLLGGVLVELQGQMWDGSLRGRLLQVHRELLKEE